MKRDRPQKHKFNQSSRLRERKNKGALDRGEMKDCILHIAYFIRKQWKEAISEGPKILQICIRNKIDNYNK